MLSPHEYQERERLADEREVLAEMRDRFDEPTAAEVLAERERRERETSHCGVEKLVIS